jgi:adenine C2-methylase RlmN of 23S rRNA A2503 and tRNA A37
LLLVHRSPPFGQVSVHSRRTGRCRLLPLLLIRPGLNFIVWNPVAGLPFAAPPRERIVALVRRVKQGGVLATIRDSTGPDAEAACGQLRLRHRDTQQL